jgi:hypothetical protein
MKASARYILPLIFLFLVGGCSIFRSQETGTLFTFEFEGQTYEIAGYTNPRGESANYLTHRDQENVLFRAIDHNRSGIIDQVVSGSIGVMEANRIYQAGIQIAMEKDLFKNIDRNRTYEMEYADYQLVVETYMKGEDEFHNRFVLFTLSWELVGIFWDDNSDGTIDRRESGEIELSTAQDYYSIALEKAEEDQRLIETDNEQIIIKKNIRNNRGVAGIYE